MAKEIKVFESITNNAELLAEFYASLQGNKVKVKMVGADGVTFTSDIPPTDRSPEALVASLERGKVTDKVNMPAGTEASVSAPGSADARAALVMCNVYGTAKGLELIRQRKEAQAKEAQRKEALAKEIKVREERSAAITALVAALANDQNRDDKALTDEAMSASDHKKAKTARTKERDALLLEQANITEEVHALKEQLAK